MSSTNICTRCGGLGTIGDYYWSDDENTVTDNIQDCPVCGGTGTSEKGGAMRTRSTSESLSETRELLLSRLPLPDIWNREQRNQELARLYEDVPVGHKLEGVVAGLNQYMESEVERLLDGYGLDWFEDIDYAWDSWYLTPADIEELGRLIALSGEEE